MEIQESERQRNRERERDMQSWKRREEKAGKAVRGRKRKTV